MQAFALLGSFPSALPKLSTLFTPKRLQSFPKARVSLFVVAVPAFLLFLGKKRKTFSRGKLIFNDTENHIERDPAHTKKNSSE